MLWSTLSLMASDLEKKDLITSFRTKIKILQQNKLSTTKQLTEFKAIILNLLLS